MLKPFGRHKMENITCTHANVVAYITFQRNGNPNDFLLYIGSVFGSLNAIQIGLWKFNQYA